MKYRAIKDGTGSNSSRIVEGKIYEATIGGIHDGKQLWRIFGEDGKFICDQLSINGKAHFVEYNDGLDEAVDL